jgi:hypothetical protein
VRLRRHIQERLIDFIVPRGYVPDLDAARRHDEAFLYAAHPFGFHVWVGTAAGRVCSFCGRVREWTGGGAGEPPASSRGDEYQWVPEHAQASQGEDVPLFLAPPVPGAAA